MSDIHRPSLHEDPLVVSDEASPAADPHELTVPFDRSGGRVPVHGATPQDSTGSTDLIDDLKAPDNRAKMLVAIAIMSLASLILMIVLTASVVADDEPVLVDGVQCLVQDGADGEARLFCER